MLPLRRRRGGGHGGQADELTLRARFQREAQLMPCCTMSSGMTFHASRAVALALWAPSI